MGEEDYPTYKRPGINNELSLRDKILNTILLYFRSYMAQIFISSLILMIIELTETAKD